MMNFIAMHLKYPVKALENKIHGKVILWFVIDSTGKVGGIEVVRSLSTDCDNEAIRVVKLLPNFIPAKQNGENVAV